MMMETLPRFLAMGGYASFVWPAYAFAASVMTALLWTSVSSYRRQRRKLETLRAPRSRQKRAA
jgi:heme exporter protein CcmD